jgi:restriction system protein
MLLVKFNGYRYTNQSKLTVDLKINFDEWLHKCDVINCDDGYFNPLFTSFKYPLGRLLYPNVLSFLQIVKNDIQISNPINNNKEYQLYFNVDGQIIFQKITEQYSNIYFKIFKKYPQIEFRSYGDSIKELMFESEIMFANLLRVWNIGLIETVNKISGDDSNINIYQKNIDLLKEMLDILNSEYDFLWFNNKQLLNEVIEENIEYNRLNSIIFILNKLKEPPKEEEIVLPNEPNYDDISLNFFNSVFLSKKAKRELIEKELDILKNKWEIDYNNKKYYNLKISKLNNENELIYSKYKSFIKLELDTFVENFNYKKSTFKKSIIDYKNNKNIELYFSTTIVNSVIGKYFKIDFDLQYIKETKILIIDFSLPTINILPKTKDFKYLKTKDEFVEKEYNSKEHNTIYNEFIYKIVFRVLYDVSNSDINLSIETISFNGWVNSINPKNGKFENKCILTLSAKKQSILDINIEHINPYDAFKGLKGISAVQLSEYTAIAPILNINKEDKRFVQSEAVLKNISNTTNIAAIGWEEFEHLIRELFEKEFEVNGGEVKVTQTSRDGGVDAVAFDPDPIRGGKIVIQSKRYTNVVGVSAVRDLYGTVMNEGATKGILVTTSYYGSDAYEFAKDKPITLIDGSGLLSLLQKHSFNARIDLNEAKKINKENNN